MNRSQELGINRKQMNQGGKTVYLVSNYFFPTFLKFELEEQRHHNSDFSAASSFFHSSGSNLGKSSLTFFTKSDFSAHPLHALS